ncbi:MAG: hypothetical protein ACREU3_16915 [Steroidobacteraceae bacterium]
MANPADSYSGLAVRKLNEGTFRSLEVCPLEKVPEVDNIDVSGPADEQINPAWEQVTARRVLIAEPVIVPGAVHAIVVTEYAARVADAAVRGALTVDLRTGCEEASNDRGTFHSVSWCRASKL